MEIYMIDPTSCYPLFPILLVITASTSIH